MIWPVIPNGVLWARTFREGMQVWHFSGLMNLSFLSGQYFISIYICSLRGYNRIYVTCAYPYNIIQTIGSLKPLECARDLWGYVLNCIFIH